MTISTTMMTNTTTPTTQPTTTATTLEEDPSSPLCVPVDGVTVVDINEDLAELVPVGEYIAAIVDIIEDTSVVDVSESSLLVRVLMDDFTVVVIDIIEDPVVANDEVDNTDTIFDTSETSVIQIQWLKTVINSHMLTNKLSCKKSVSLLYYRSCSANGYKHLKSLLSSKGQEYVNGAARLNNLAGHNLGLLTMEHIYLYSRFNFLSTRTQ